MALILNTSVTQTCVNASLDRPDNRTKLSYNYLCNHDVSIPLVINRKCPLWTFLIAFIEINLNYINLILILTSNHTSASFQ